MPCRLLQDFLFNYYYFFFFFCNAVLFQEEGYIQQELGLFSESAGCSCGLAANSELCQRCSFSAGKSEGHLNIQAHPRREGGAFFNSIGPLLRTPHKVRGSDKVAEETQWQRNLHFNAPV